MKLPAQGNISQGFTPTHLAVDIAGPYRSPIVAPHSGTVTAAGQMGTGTNNAGLAIDITGGQFKSRLAHNDQILVSVGQTVQEGQQVGLQGFTGYTIPSGQAGTHCHWVLWDNGTRVDGRNYITQGGVDMPIGADGVERLSRDVLGRPADPGMINTYQNRTDWKGVHDELEKQPEAANYRKKIQDGFNCLATSGKVLAPGKYIVN